jgi:hypothetical protein
MTAALLAVVALATVTPGQWSGVTADRAGAHARVTFGVAPSADFIQPSLRIDLRRCRTGRTLHLRPILRPVTAASGRFSVRTRFSPPARAMKVRLRVRGAFTSPDTARGVLRGRLRYAGGHTCRIPPLAFVAHPAAGSPDDPVLAPDEDVEDLGDVVVDDEDIDDGDYEEDDESEDIDDE